MIIPTSGDGSFRLGPILCHVYVDRTFLRSKIMLKLALETARSEGSTHSFVHAKATPEKLTWYQVIRNVLAFHMYCWLARHLLGEGIHGSLPVKQ